jgi:integrase
VRGDKPDEAFSIAFLRYQKVYYRTLSALSRQEPPIVTTTPEADRALADAEAFRQAAKPESTLRAYDADVDRYAAWCARVGLTAFPATPVVVGAYLAAHAEGFAHPTRVRWVAGIAHQARIEGAPLDTKDPAISATLDGIANTFPVRGRRAAALTIEDLRAIVDPCGEDLAGRRDRALLLVGFAGALRRSELAALEVGDIRWTREGLVLTIYKSKGDQKGEGAELAIVQGEHAATCPVAALRAWLTQAKISTGPVFRKVARGGHVQADRLSGGGVWQIVTRRCRAVGLEAPSGEYLSPHSLRAGFVTSAYAAAVPDEEIMGQTRHKHLETMRGYVRRARLAGGASGKVGL